MATKLERFNTDYRKNKYYSLANKVVRSMIPHTLEKVLEVSSWMTCNALEMNHLLSTALMLELACTTVTTQVTPK